MKRLVSALVFSFALAPPASASGVPDPAPFDAVLEKRARNGGFDYARNGRPGPQAPRRLSREPRRRARRRR